jgi:hypothetical protein
MAKLVNTDLDFGGVAKVTNLAAPSSAADAATKGYVDSAVEGLNWKDSARVSTQGNLNLSSPGAAIDGVTLSNGDRVLVRAQTAEAENGIYIFNGAASAMTRAADASTGDELEQATVTIEEGTDAGATFRQTEIDITLDTDDVLFTAFGTAAPSASESTAGLIEIATQAETDAGADDARAITPSKLANWSGRRRKHAANFGDNSATQYDITHNFDTLDVVVSIFRNSDGKEVLCEITRTNSNTVRINTAAAVATNAYRAVILG